MSEIPTRFPKVQSPYLRGEDDDGDYTIEASRPFTGSYLRDEFSWLVERADEVEAIEKLDGTNMAIHIGEHEHGGLSVTDVATRMGDKLMNRVEPFGPRTNHHYITRAVQNSISRGYTDQLAEAYGKGWFFGEAVGPKFQGNPHKLDEQLFIPFDWVRDKLEYKSYGKYSTEFEDIRDWFKGEENGLFSLFASRMHGQPLDASRPVNGTFVEGLIFIHPDFDGRITPEHMTTNENGKVQQIVKLRRDMYHGFQKGEWPMDEYGH